MPATPLTPTQLRLSIAPDSLGFASTADLRDLPLPWIGQERAEAAARFGLGMEQPDYNLFVLGEVGSGRTTLMHQAMKQAAAAARRCRRTCATCTTSTPPSAPRAAPACGTRAPAAPSAWRRSARTLQADIPKRLDGADFSAESERIEKTYEARGVAGLCRPGRPG